MSTAATAAVSAAQSLAANGQNPLQTLTFIAAPALLTNACSLLVLSTSNRFARAVDRARLLVKSADDSDTRAALRRVERRSLLLVRALIGLYVAVGSFGASTFLGLLGSAIFALGHTIDVTLITEGSVAFASLGVLSIATAAAHLVRETWVAYRGLMIEAQLVSRHRLLDTHEI